MKINENSWHYKTQNFWLNYEDHPGKKPKSICNYFWITVFLMLVSSIIFVAGILLLVGMFIISYVVAPFFGYYPNKFSWIAIPSTNHLTENAVLKPRKPLIATHWWNFYGYHFIITCGVGWFLVCQMDDLKTLITVYNASVVNMLIAFIVAIVIVLLIIASSKDIIHDTWQLIKSYIKARKEKVCPFITYVQEEKAVPPAAG